MQIEIRHLSKKQTEALCGYAYMVIPNQDESKAYACFNRDHIGETVQCILDNLPIGTEI